MDAELEGKVREASVRAGGPREDGNAEDGRNGHDDVAAAPTNLHAFDNVKEAAQGKGKEMVQRGGKNMDGVDGVRARKSSGRAAFITRSRAG